MSVAVVLPPEVLPVLAVGLEDARVCPEHVAHSVVQGQLLVFGVGFGVGVTKNPRVGFGTGLGFDTFYSVISSNARV